MPQARAALLEPDRAERNAELDRPAAVEVGRLRLPDRVPVGVGVLVGDLANRSCRPARWRRRRSRCGGRRTCRASPRSDRCCRDWSRRGACRSSRASTSRSPTAARRRRARRRRKPTQTSVFSVAGSPFVRLLLDEVADRLVLAVEALVEPAVEHERLGEPDRANRDVALGVARDDGRRHRRGRAVDEGRASAGRAAARRERPPEDTRGPRR